MMNMYINDTLIPKMVEGMSNGTAKANRLKNYGLTKLCQEKVGDWLIKLGFKYNYDVNN